MARKGNDTLTGILDAAEAMILRHGFGATSLDAVLQNAGLTKGAFFHHFRSKNDLAHALIERFARRDAELLDTLVERAERLSRDPLQQVLLLVGLLAEMMDERDEPFPGCLYATYSYEAQLFDDRTHAVIREGLLRWRERLGEKLRLALAAHPPRLPAEPDELADMLNVIVEGAYIMSRTLGDARAAAAQLRHYRNYLELLFGVAAVAARQAPEAA